MFERINTLVRHFTRDFRWADLIEIVLVALFFYLFITWLRSSITRRASRNALVALLLASGQRPRRQPDHRRQFRRRNAERGL